MVVNGADAEREGQLIGDTAIRMAGWTGPIHRLWPSDMTENGVRSAFANILPPTAKANLFEAAKCRQMADWIVGMNMTRMMTSALRRGVEHGQGELFTVGRAQTAALYIVWMRERAIREFRPTDYFELTADVVTEGGHRLKMRHTRDRENWILDKKEAERLAALAQGKHGPLKVERAKKKKSPPNLPNLSDVQVYAGSKWGWSGDKTLKVAQTLYEEHKLLSYPRADEQHLPTAMKDKAPEILGALASAGLAPFKVTPIFRKQHYDDSKIKSHYALSPTTETADWSKLTDDERKLYTYVAQRYLAVHLPDYEYEATSVRLTLDGVEFKANGQVPQVEGWKAAFKLPSGEGEGEDEADDDTGDGKGGDDEGANRTLPPVKNGERGDAEKVRVDAKRTTPPSPHTETTLLQALTDVKGIDGLTKEQVAKLRERSGIGTQATRASIIATLKDKRRNYVVSAGKSLKLTVTPKGNRLIEELLRMSLSAFCDPVTTARWEDGLHDVADGKLAPQKFIEAIKVNVSTAITKIKASDIAGFVGGPAKGKGKTPDAGKPKGPPTEEQKAAYLKRLEGGTDLKVPYAKRDHARDLGAKFHPAKKAWIAIKGADLAPFRQAGYL